MQRTVAHLYESDAEFVIEVQLAGSGPEALEVAALDHTVLVTGGLETDPEGFGKTAARSSTFRREFPFPAGADMEHLRAVLFDDVLELHAPRTAGPRFRRIEVHTPFAMHADVCPT
jgi:HSP20 family molecular chaperone IbpA